MFSDDVRNSILPYSFSTLETKSSIHVIGNNSISDSAIISYLFSGRQDLITRPPSEPIIDFLRDVAFVLAYRGKTLMEVVKDRIQISIGDENTLCTAYRLVHIPGITFRWINNYIQLVPRREWKKYGMVFNAIPKSATWSIQLPKKLGGVIKHNMLLRKLVLSTEVVPRFFDDFSEGIGKNQVDLTEFHNTRTELMANATARWGWDARLIFKDRVLEYYLLYRKLKFARTLSVLREYILSEINQMLSNLGLPYEIEILGLLKPQEFDNVLDLFGKGEYVFEDIINLL